MRLPPLLAAVAAAAVLAPAAAEAAPRIAVSPRAVDADATQKVTGRGWPVFENCVRRVRVAVRSDQNAARVGAARVRRSGRFRFTWTPADAGIGPGRWRLVVRMRCESGDDGSTFFIRRRAAIRVRG